MQNRIKILLPSFLTSDQLSAGFYLAVFSICLIQSSQFFSFLFSMWARVEVLSKNNVRLAVNSGEKNFFTAKRPHLLALNAVKAVNFVRFSLNLAVKFFFHRISYKKETAVQRFEPLTYPMSPTSYSTAPSVAYFNNISCEFKTSVEFSGEYL